MLKTGVTAFMGRAAGDEAALDFYEEAILRLHCIRNQLGTFFQPSSIEFATAKSNWAGIGIYRRADAN